MQQATTKTTRQYGREDIDFPVELLICPQHQSQVTFSANSTANAAHIVRGSARDISSSGVGITCAQFVPRMCEGVLRIFDPVAGSAKPRLLLEHPVKVRRVYMTSHEPTYALGVAFVAPDSELSQRVESLLASLSSGKGAAANE